VGRYYPKSGDGLRVVGFSSEKCRSGEAARRHRLAVDAQHLCGVEVRALERKDTRFGSSERWVVPAIAEAAASHSRPVACTGCTSIFSSHIEQANEVDLPHMMNRRGKLSSPLRAAGISAAYVRQASVRRRTPQAATRGSARLFDQAHKDACEPAAHRLSSQVLFPQVHIEKDLGLTAVGTFEPVLHEHVRECPLLRVPLAASSKSFRLRSAKIVRISHSLIRS